ncbi:helix-turn-helix transcriptional regulator [Burkholderia sp. WSM2230]|uniref:helix-turn-helix transcriptional regulator n=1 Tax=Burkholderia sp. WSM2230 TaxID=944435 RepID=UPI001E28A3F0|nr:helix-turn-helix transcriptional regulator [Burkholderia sp. WSM2230]
MQWTFLAISIRSSEASRRLTVTPHQYIIESRLQAARNLIASGQCDVTKAALVCGFATVSHFSATFRKRWGISPSELKPSLIPAMQEGGRVSTDR